MGLKIPRIERVWSFICPLCFNGVVTVYQRTGVMTGHGLDNVFEYKGGCCAYYPAENPLVDAAVKKFERENMKGLKEWLVASYENHDYTASEYRDALKDRNQTREILEEYCDSDVFISECRDKLEEILECIDCSEC